MNASSHTRVLSELEHFRSEGLPRGYFSQIGNLHVHVDGGSDFDTIRKLLTSLEPGGELGKLNSVVGSIAGPQRKVHADTYASHTPGAKNIERFEYFATMGFRGR